MPSEASREPSNVPPRPATSRQTSRQRATPIAEHGQLTPAVTAFAVAAAVGGFLFGFDTAVINGAVTAIETNLGLDSIGLGAVVAVTLLGAALGSLAAGWMADRIGRPRTMLAAGVVLFIAAIGCGLAQGVVDLAAWRLLTGFAVGFATVLGPLYISEIAPAHARGRLSSMQQMAIVLGIFVALLSDSGIALALGGADAELFLGLPAWRWMFIAGIVPAIIYVVLSLVAPESPRYLVARGRVDSAQKALIRLQRITPATATELTDRIQDTRWNTKSRDDSVTCSIGVAACYLSRSDGGRRNRHELSQHRVLGRRIYAPG